VPFLKHYNKASFLILMMMFVITGTRRSFLKKQLEVRGGALNKEFS
jgi:hypothetical protein